jgi:hypothetical protein
MIINFGHPFDDWPLRTLHSFCDCTPSALNEHLTSSSCYTLLSSPKNLYYRNQARDINWNVNQKSLQRKKLFKITIPRSFISSFLILNYFTLLLNERYLGMLFCKHGHIT